jgi:hypothetical protein
MRSWKLILSSVVSDVQGAFSFLGDQRASACGYIICIKVTRSYTGASQVTHKFSRSFRKKMSNRGDIRLLANRDVLLPTINPVVS